MKKKEENNPFLIKHSAFRVYAILFFIAFFFTSTVDVFSAHAFPSTQAPQKNHKNLFSLSIEELINISVTGNKEDSSFENSIYIVSGNTISNLSVTLDHITQNRKIEKSNNQSLLLLIDGFSVGRVNSISELKSYTDYFGNDLKQIEFYFDENVLWWDDDTVSAVVNIVTTQSFQNTMPAPETRLQNQEVSP